MVDRRHRESELRHIISQHNVNLRIPNWRVELVECNEEIADTEHDRTKHAKQFGDIL